MKTGLGARIVALSLLLATGGCEFLKEHVRVKTDDRQPGNQYFTGPHAESESDRIEFAAPLHGE